MNLTDLLRSSLFVLAHWFGGSFGAAIIAASVAMRIVMLPVTIGATRRRLAREAKLRTLGPELERLKQRHAGKPKDLMTATERLYAANGIAFVDRRSFIDMLLQFPPAALLYSAINGLGRDVGGFMWVKSLASPDRALALAAGLVSAAAAWAAGRSPESRQAVVLLPLAITGVVTYVFLSHVPAVIALYSVTNSVVAAVEQAVVRRSMHRTPA
jgi:YidC/Oxa1 family membrane protein insertase